MARNTTGATLLGIGIFGGIPATLYAATNLDGGIAVLCGAATALLVGIGISSEKHEDAREKDGEP